MAAKIPPILRLFLAVAGLAVAALAASPAGAEIYMWKDKNGVLHFSDAPLNEYYRPLKWGQIELPKVIHPSLYDHLILEAAEDNDLEFALVKAVIRVESGFNPDAVSPAGAQGLMQIMPETCLDLGVKDPFNPRQNIQGGCTYLKGLLDQFGNLTLALAAYNAGPGAVERYNNSIPPFPETRTYVKRVLDAYDKLSRQASTSRR